MKVQCPSNGMTICNSGDGFLRLPKLTLDRKLSVDVTMGELDTHIVQTTLWSNTSGVTISDRHGDSN